MHPLIRSCTEVAPGALPTVDLHMHTTWTDGARSVVEMHEAALAAGLTAILFSEHARKSSGDWFADFAAEVHALPTDRCVALVGTEVKIADFDGSLDISDEVRRECDLVMASVHRFPGETTIHKAGPLPVSPQEAVEIEYQLSRAAIRAGGFDILGHPFAMSIRRFGVEPPAERWLEVARLCAEHGIAFEINARYHADPWRLVSLCRSVGAPISLGSNAHDADEVGAIHRMLAGSEGA